MLVILLYALGGKEDAIGLSETGTDIIAAGSGCVDNNMAAYTQSLDGTNSACTFILTVFMQR